MKQPQRPLIAFDATPLELPRPSGVGRYTAQLLAALIARPDAPRIALVAGRTLPPTALAGTLGQVGMSFPNRSLWMQLVLPRTLQTLQPSLCHFTNFIAPIMTRTPYVVTFHDMSLFQFAETQSLKHRLAARWIIGRAAKAARTIITVSESARRDIVEVLKVAPERVRVISNAADPQFRPIHDAVELLRVRTKYGLDAPFILHVGTIEPRKNLRRLVDAVVRLRKEGRSEQLILAGQLGWRYRELLAHLDHAAGPLAVKRLDYVDAADLPVLYNLARLVALPSLYEGFGLPILEAMACGVPVLTSDRSSMSEIAGGAAVLVDPESTDAIAAGLRAALDDEARRQTLSAQGLQRASQFSWDRTATQTIQVYEEIAG